MSCITSGKQAVTSSVTQVILHVEEVFCLISVWDFLRKRKKEESCHHEEKQISIFLVTYPNRFRHLSYPPRQMILPLTAEQAQRLRVLHSTQQQDLDDSVKQGNSNFNP